MANAKWPYRGANHQWDADKLHRFPIVAQAAAEGIKLTDMWYGELPTAPSRVYPTYEGGQKFIDQMREAVPGMDVMRQLFNQWHLQDPTNGFHDPQSNGFVDRWVETGGSFLWVLMDGPSQRAYGDEPGKFKYWKSYPDPVAIAADPEGTFEHVMGKIYDSQVKSWTALCKYLQSRPDVLEATVGFELINEPDTYATSGDLTGNHTRSYTRYVQHCAKLTDLIDTLLPNHGKDIYVGGWDYSAKINKLYRSSLPAFGGKSAAQVIVDHVGRDRFVWSLHMYPSWNPQKPVSMDAFEQGVRDVAGDAMDDGLRIALTEFNSQNTRANSLDYDDNNYGDRKDFMMSRATKIWRDNNISLFWWPLANWAMGSVIDARGTEDGLKNYHQNSLFAFINVMADNNNPTWFTGPASGIRQATFVAAPRGTTNEQNDPDRFEKAVDNVPGFGLGFGGSGEATVSPVEDANNFLFGGGGYNVLVGSGSNDDYMSLGTGGGEVYAFGGYNFINTNGGKNVIFGGWKWTQISCYWGVNDIHCDPMGITNIIGWNPERGDRIGFQNTLPVTQRIETKKNETDLILEFAEGGEVRIVGGAKHADSIMNYNLDDESLWLTDLEVAADKVRTIALAVNELKT